MSEPITLREWLLVVRRARLGRTTKAVALMLSTYADTDGSRVYPGIARLAVDCELTYNVVQTSMAQLRAAGLIELVRQAARRGDSDEYRLIISEDVLELVDVLTPAQVTVEADKMQQRRRGKYQSTADLHPTATGAGVEAQSDPHPTAWGAAPVDNSDLHPAPWGAESHADGAPAPHAVHAYADLHPTASAPAPHGVGTHRVTTETQPHRPTPTNDLGTDASGPHPRDAATENDHDSGCSAGYALVAGALAHCRCNPPIDPAGALIDQELPLWPDPLSSVDTPPAAPTPPATPEAASAAANTSPRPKPRPRQPVPSSRSSTTTGHHPPPDPPTPPPASSPPAPPAGHPPPPETATPAAPGEPWPIVHIRRSDGSIAAAELREDDPARNNVKVIYLHSRTSAWIARKRIVNPDQPDAPPPYPPAEEAA